MARPRVVAVYVSAHGFGHAVRTGEVIRALLAADDDVVVHVRAAAPDFLFPRDERVLRSPVACDAGMVQATSMTVDLDATLARLDAIERDFEGRTVEEARWLDAIGADVVLGDVPPMAFAAARRASVASFAMANFSWDWIYRHYAGRDRRFAVHAARAAACYGQCGTLLRLPLHAEMAAFPRVVDVPLVAPRFPCARDEARARLGLPADRPIVVLSFSGPGLAGFEAARLGGLSGMVFVTTEPLAAPPGNVIVLSPSTLDYTLLLSAADAVVTKPGYGIVATCLRNGLRVLCARRDDFPEASVLEDALLRCGTAEVITARELASASFGPRLDELLARPVAPVAWAGDGAHRVAEILLGASAA